jgi:hypothetical protein
VNIFFVFFIYIRGTKVEGRRERGGEAQYRWDRPNHLRSDPSTRS